MGGWVGYLFDGESFAGVELQHPTQKVEGSYVSLGEEGVHGGRGGGWEGEEEPRVGGWCRWVVGLEERGRGEVIRDRVIGWAEEDLYLRALADGMKYISSSVGRPNFKQINRNWSM